MAREYVVYVAAPLASETADVAERLGTVLGLDERKVQSLLRRLPDVITKPITRSEAEAVVERFGRAGLVARVRPVSDPGSLQPEPVEPLAFSDDDDMTLETDGQPQPGLILDPFRTIPPEDEPEPEAAPPAPPAERGAMFETFEEVTPAELQARLRGTSVMGAADAAEEPEPEPVPAAPARKGRRQREDKTEQVVRPPREDGQADRKRSGSLQAKLMTTAVIPVLLAIAGALAAIWLTARPALYQQLLDSARNPAIATAASLSSAFQQSSDTEGGIDYLQLQDTILITRQAFPREDIAFIIATDTLGNPLPGFFVGGSSLTAGVQELQDAIRTRALGAIGLGASSESTQLPAADGTRIEIVAQPLVVDDEPVGAIVVGVSDRAVTAQVNRIVINVLLFSLVPLLLAILIAYRRARHLTGNVLQLTERADRISRGELEEQVEFRSNDELDDLAAALERMRVSMRGALERLRRRR